MEFFFSLGQLIKLTGFVGERGISQDDVLFFDRASIDYTLSTIAPILDLPEGVVVSFPANIHPIKQGFLLIDVWIDSVAIVECQHWCLLVHKLIIQSLQANATPLNVKVSDIEPPNLT